MKGATDTVSGWLRTLSRRATTVGLLTVAALTMVPTASAHGSIGTVTNEWLHLVALLQGVTVLGVGIIAASVWFGRTRWALQPRRVVTGILVGVAVAMIGTIGITQIQILPIGTTPSPTLRAWYPRLAFVAGSAIMLGSLFLGWRYWFDKPRYWLLGILLGLWVLYPVTMPRQGLTNPLGYVLVSAVLLGVGYIVWCDVRLALFRDVTDRFARRVGVTAAILFGVFYLFSAGLLTVNPDEGVNAPTHAFFTVASFSNPLVMWPAVEFGAPSVPFFAGLSIGTVLVIGLLAGLVGINASLMTAGWLSEVELSSSEGMVGFVATTGATACCCCGPAVYAMASGVFGMMASPLFWAFTSPTSPFGALFFVSSVALLTGSSIRLTRSLADAGVCELPGTGTPPSGEHSARANSVDDTSEPIQNNWMQNLVPDRRTVLVVVLLVGFELLLAGIYVAARDVRVTDPLVLVYPFIWIDVSLLAVLTTNPHPETTRQRLVGVGIAGGYFLVLGYFGGLYGVGNGMVPLHLDWGLPLGYSPAVLYDGLLRVVLMPYKVVGYIALAYLVYTTVIDAARAAISGVVGLFSCISCSWPVLGTVATSLFGSGSVVATFVLRQSYGLGTLVFLSAVALLYYRPRF